MATCLPSLKSDLNGEVEMGEDGKVGEMLLPLGDLGAKVVVTHPGFKNSFSIQELTNSELTNKGDAYLGRPGNHPGPKNQTAIFCHQGPPSTLPCIETEFHKNVNIKCGSYLLFLWVVKCCKNSKVKCRYRELSGILL